MKSDSTLEFVAALAEEAGKLAQSLRREASRDFVAVKGEMDFVTHADRQVESLIRSRMAGAFPGEAILGEEEGGDVSGTFWVVDPIDGTTNYLKGLREWGVCIARVQDGVITHGVTICPDLDLVAKAVNGGGACINGAPVQARSERSIALVQLGYSPRIGLSEHLAQIERVISRGADYRRSGAACVGLLSVTAGWSDIFYEKHLNLWDAASGLLLVAEAGGRSAHSDLSEFASHGSEVLAIGRSAEVEADDWATLFGTPA